MSDYNDDGLGPFALQGAILRAWNTTVMTVLDGYEGKRDKEFMAHATRFEDSDTMLFFGYIAQAIGQVIMQSKIVNALASNPESRQAKRQDIKRRADAVELFGLIKREYLSDVAVQFSLTEEGREVLEMYEAAYAAEVRKLKGDEDDKDAA
ncbi:hypothetical protein TRP8649_04744 [Pelagimonas phthalicica]|uniref:Uncharacterized protein n=1 Tax=Pelagimonas phthalicica TaxID=1037362 RepID=A0A238JIU7_9RHOB|nr:hypothetical protein [Pelagimonas phthalicica]TDS87044.1 hypothetical protein CLV87_4833 [Pelagimonas phthalicica]SMX30600.1 hypothetical protein TRP8649_04744 [Pelagimonas phthalicica]